MDERAFSKVSRQMLTMGFHPIDKVTKSKFPGKWPVRVVDSKAEGNQLPPPANVRNLSDVLCRQYNHVLCTG